MYIKPCPICGQLPKITECCSRSDNRRRRMCGTSCFHNILPAHTLYGMAYSYFVFNGEGDDNDIYKVWNNGITEQEKRKEEGFKTMSNKWLNDVPEGSWIE